SRTRMRAVASRSAPTVARERAWLAVFLGRTVVGRSTTQSSRMRVNNPSECSYNARNSETKEAVQSHDERCVRPAHASQALGRSGIVQCDCRWIGTTGPVDGHLS